MQAEKNAPIVTVVYDLEKYELVEPPVMRTSIVDRRLTLKSVSEEDMKKSKLSALLALGVPFERVVYLTFCICYGSFDFNHITMSTDRLNSRNMAMAVISLVEGIQNSTKRRNITDLKFSLPDLTILEGDQFPACSDGTVFFVNHLKIDGSWRTLLLPETIKEKRCFFCFKPANNKCSKCLKARYCSSDCQTLGWRQHKQTCKSSNE
jgi:hypothetical protein